LKWGNFATLQTRVKQFLSSSANRASEAASAHVLTSSAAIAVLLKLEPLLRIQAPKIDFLPNSLRAVSDASHTGQSCCVVRIVSNLLLSEKKQLLEGVLRRD